MDDITFERLIKCWPPDWPGKSVVDLDDFGDCGHYLQEFLWNNGGKCFEDKSIDLEDDADILRDMYLQAIEDQGRSFPFDCFKSSEQAMEAIREDFKAFLNCWRDRAQR